MKPTFAILFLLFPLMGTAAVPDLADVAVRDPVSRSAARGLDSFLPPERHVLIVVDARSARAESLLHALAREGFSGSHGTVLLMSASEPAATLRTVPTEWTPAQVLVGEPATIRAELAAVAPVTVFGIGADGRIAWRHAGQPKSVTELLAQILDWIDP